MLWTAVARLGQLFQGPLAEGFVEGGLLVAQLHLQRQLGPRRQFGQHLRLGAPQEERLDQLFQPPPRLVAAVAFDRHGETLLEMFERAEQPRIDELEQVPQFAEMVFQRRASHDQPELGRQTHRRLRPASGHVLDRLGFVQNHRVPGLRLKPGRFGVQQAIAADHDVAWAEVLEEGVAVPRPEQAGVECRGEAIRLVQPVEADRR